MLIIILLLIMMVRVMFFWRITKVILLKIILLVIMMVRVMILGGNESNFVDNHITRGHDGTGDVFFRVIVMIWNRICIGQTN